MVKKTRKDGVGGGLEPDDKAIWQAVTKDVKTIHPEKDNSFNALKEDKNPILLQINKELPNKSISLARPHKALPQLDLRTDLRLKKGQMTIEARLDLHGHNQISAHESFKSFIIRSSNAGFRCVLVITGKGESGINQQDESDWNSPQRGILKKMLPVWVNDPSIAPLILKFYLATQKHGGQGAYYIYLKRIRAY